MSSILYPAFSTSGSHVVWQCRSGIGNAVIVSLFLFVIVTECGGRAVSVYSFFVIDDIGDTDQLVSQA